MICDRSGKGAVLIIYPGALGDLVCFGPALRAVTRRHPGQSLELMARAELARFAVGRMRVSAGHSIDRREMSVLFAPAVDQEPARKLFGCFGRIYSFFAADNPSFRDALAAAAGGLVSFHPFRPPGPGHVAQAYVRSIGEDATAPLSARIEPLAEDIAAASRRLARMGILAGEFALIFPGSGGRAKNWPAENYAALAEHIGDQIMPIVVIGPAERELRAFFESRRLAVMSELELGEVAGLARLARCFIGNDSGVSHLAAAVGARGIAIFGPTDPVRWAPLGKVAIIHRDPIETISPNEVFAMLTETIGRGGRDSKDCLWRQK
jgi:heptosyltransferase-3